MPLSDYLHWTVGTMEQLVRQRSATMLWEDLCCVNRVLSFVAITGCLSRLLLANRALK